MLRFAFEVEHFGVCQHFSFQIEHINQVRVVAFADFVVVEVMRRCDFHATGAEVFFNVFVGNHGDGTAGQRQNQFLSNQMGITFVLGIDGNGHVAQQRFGTGGGDDDGFGGIVRQRIADMPQKEYELVQEEGHDTYTYCTGCQPSTIFDRYDEP